mgnify:CR=1 FL=1
MGPALISSNSMRKEGLRARWSAYGRRVAAASLGGSGLVAASASRDLVTAFGAFFYFLPERSEVFFLFFFDSNAWCFHTKQRGCFGANTLFSRQESFQEVGPQA